jgi:hypothetical protein
MNLYFFSEIKIIYVKIDEEIDIKNLFFAPNCKEVAEFFPEKSLFFSFHFVNRPNFLISINTDNPSQLYFISRKVKYSLI